MSKAPPQGLTDWQIEQLGQKLDPSNIQERKAFDGGSKTLSYIEGWFALAEANRIFGPTGWSRRTVRIEEVSNETLTVAGKRDKPDRKRFGVAFMAIVEITVHADGHDTTRSGTGYGDGQSYTSRNAAYELAIKEAETDATKRALMTLGYPLGLALYDKERKYVGNGAAEPEPEPQTPQMTDGTRKLLEKLDDIGMGAQDVVNAIAQLWPNETIDPRTLNVVQVKAVWQHINAANDPEPQTPPRPAPDDGPAPVSKPFGDAVDVAGIRAALTVMNVDSAIQDAVILTAAAELWENWTDATIETIDALANEHLAALLDYITSTQGDDLQDLITKASARSAEPAEVPA